MSRSKTVAKPLRARPHLRPTCPVLITTGLHVWFLRQRKYRVLHRGAITLQGSIKNVANEEIPLVPNWKKRGPLLRVITHRDFGFRVITHHSLKFSCFHTPCQYCSCYYPPLSLLITFSVHAHKHSCFYTPNFVFLHTKLRVFTHRNIQKAPFFLFNINLLLTLPESRNSINSI
jgi:hypothetical protein